MTLPKKIKALIPYYSYNMHYSDEDKAWVVSVVELPGCMTHGDDPAHAMKMAREAAELYLETCLEQGESIPEPLSKINVSGEFIVRSNPELHRKLIQKAISEGYKTLNKYVVAYLEELVLSRASGKRSLK